MQSPVDINAMALYGQRRVQQSLSRLQGKPTWSIEDTADFDCMHYEGNAALDRAVSRLGAQPGATVLDVGAGYGGTGRYLHNRYGLHTVSLELQPEIHDVASLINNRTGMPATVRSVRGNFLEPKTASLVGAPLDYVVSFLCILHIPDRTAVFARLGAMLGSGGRAYIEDYAARRPLTPEEKLALREVVACPYLPDHTTYVKDVNAAGFDVVHDEDLSGEWTQFVSTRAQAYRARPDGEPAMVRFYDTVENLFVSGAVAGVALTLQRRS